MMESIFRAHQARLQQAYDCMPYPVQNLLTSARGWFLTRSRYTQDMYSLLSSLRRHETWTPEQIRLCQLAEMRHIVEQARKNVPFYADYPPLELKGLDDIRDYPVLMRELVRQNSERFVSRHLDGSQCIRVATTGTTGASLKVAYSPAVSRRHWAFRMRQWAWAGVEPRHARITLFGNRIVPPDRTEPPYWTYNLTERQVLMSIFHLSENVAPSYIKFLQKHQSKVLEGFPSVLGILADFILHRREQVPMRAVFADGEPLYPFLREKVEKAFATRAYDLYGNTEYCGLIVECERRQMHLAPEYAYLEILDADGQPVRPGEEGYFVWTGFINDAMPLIRYRIGDRGCWKPDGPCSCGRAFPLVITTISRESDLLTCPDGRIFSPRALNQILKTASGFRFCQFVQDKTNHVLVRAVPGNNNAPEEVARTRSDLQKLLGKSMQVTAELAPEPITRAGGKIPLIVQQVSS